MAKTKSNTGIRNNDLFCGNCGGSYKINYPQQVNMVTAMMKEFAKEHKDCKPTWTEPTIDQTKSLNERMMFWLAKGERGMSSETIFQTLSAQKIHGRNHHPYDPDDFKRCYKLLQTIPEWKGELHKLKPLSKEWANLVDNWDKLTEFYEDMLKVKKANGMYEFMQTLIE